MLDVSASMAFGSQGRLKSDVTEGVAEVAARLAVRRGGRIGVVARGRAGAASSCRRPAAAPRSPPCAALVRGVVAEDGTDGVRLGRRAAARRPPRAHAARRVVVVSDFRDDGWARAAAPRCARATPCSPSR